MASVRAPIHFGSAVCSAFYSISNVSGTLSSNLPNDSVGSWEQIPLDNLATAVGQGGTVISDQIVSSGGCNDTATLDDSCAIQSTYVINGNGHAVTALNCPAPRLSPTVIPNGNSNSTAFGSQVLLLLGTFNTSLWDDGEGLKQGEVVSLRPALNFCTEPMSFSGCS